VGAVSGVMRMQANGIRIPESERPQVWDAGIVRHWRRWAKLRTQLYPYLAAADRTYRRRGLPIMRHLALVHPDDPRAVRQDDQFMFGPDLLAAPVLDPGARRREVYLPRGRWVDLWRSARYHTRDGGLSLRRPRLLRGGTRDGGLSLRRPRLLRGGTREGRLSLRRARLLRGGTREGRLSLRRARLLRGGRQVRLPAPLAELPLLARAGTLLPLLPPDVDTLASYGDGAPAVSLRERRGRRVLLAFPRGRSSARLEDGGVLRSREGRGEWRLSIRSRRTRRWEVEASLATLRRPFRPCTAQATGGRLLRWRYDRSARVLVAVVTARRGALVARACPQGR
jgi:Glycosyl hydrolases family 31